MDLGEYLLFIPLLIYGIALSDLFSKWKVFIESHTAYIPYLITLVMITEIGVQNVFNFFKLMPNLGSVNYFTYWLFLLPPLIFMLLVNFLTKTDDYPDFKTFFKAKAKIVFLLMAVFIALHFIPQFSYETEMWSLPRIIGIVGCILFALWHKPAVFYLLVGCWIISIGMHAYVVYK